MRRHPGVLAVALRPRHVRLGLSGLDCGSWETRRASQESGRLTGLGSVGRVFSDSMSLRNLRDTPLRLQEDSKKRPLEFGSHQVLRPHLHMSHKSSSARAAKRKQLGHVGSGGLVEPRTKPGTMNKRLRFALHTREIRAIRTRANFATLAVSSFKAV